MADAPNDNGSYDVSKDAADAAGNAATAGVVSSKVKDALPSCTSVRRPGGGVTSVGGGAGARTDVERLSDVAAAEGGLGAAIPAVAGTTSLSVANLRAFRGTEAGPVAKLPVAS
mmetsp:Transcript_2459/g.6594  ORF Transcript_2459/g.6594 Transcript_2459/m.6594 type:complete len:114 (-) Transcript_2459:524-865(-)